MYTWKRVSNLCSASLCQVRYTRWSRYTARIGPYDYLTQFLFCVIIAEGGTGVRREPRWTEYASALAVGFDDH